MLPVYKAIGFDRIMEGGTTRPWLITVLENSRPVPFVVKLYTEEYNEKNNAVLKEVICSNLAGQFELETPDAALISFDGDFIANLPEQQRNDLRNKDRNLKFGTRLIRSGYENYSRSLSDLNLKDFDLGTIYAFDNLILNLDRKESKPNLFFRDDRVVVIDHEHTFATPEGAMQALMGKRKWPYRHDNHLFFKNLIGFNNEIKRNLFDTFASYLESIVNFDELNPLYLQLEEVGLPVDRYFEIRDYLRVVKGDPSGFCRIISATINE